MEGRVMSPLIRKMERLFAPTAEEREVLESACSKVVYVDADRDIIIDGDRPWACNVLLERVVCRYKILRSGKRQILSFQFPGDIFDAQSFVLGRMDHSIATLMPCKVALIPHETMRKMTE